MPLNTLVKGLPGQVQHGWLQGVQTTILQQERLPTKRNHHCFVGLAENGRTQLFRSDLSILDRLVFAPFREGFRIDAPLPAQRRGRSLRSLNCCLSGVRGGGADVASLSVSAFFYSREWIALLNLGSKHLGQPLPFTIRAKVIHPIKCVFLGEMVKVDDVVQFLYQ